MGRLVGSLDHLVPVLARRKPAVDSGISPRRAMILNRVETTTTSATVTRCWAAQSPVRGNIGVNAAAGSLNQQANLMTLAVANDTTLAEANAGLIQTSTLSFVEQQDSQNLVTGLVIDGTSGNVGVNFASGVGNQQLNALTIRLLGGRCACEWWRKRRRRRSGLIAVRPRTFRGKATHGRKGHRQILVPPSRDLSAVTGKGFVPFPRSPRGTTAIKGRDQGRG